MKKNTKVTIADIAKKSNVSKTTVSRYINGKYELMSEETQNTIQRTIDFYGYRPSKVAQSLKSKYSKVIGCVVADITNQFSSQLVQGISSVCSKNNYQVLFINTNNNSRAEREGIMSLLDNVVDGLIVNTNGGNDEFLINVEQSGTPIVMADRCLESDTMIDTVTTSNYESALDCVQYLYDQGYDEVYFVSIDSTNNSTRMKRHDGFTDGFKKTYKTDGEDHTIYVEEGNIGLYVAELKRLKSIYPTETIALFAVNGMVMWDLIKAIKKTDYEIGVDFGLCGFDDWDWTTIIRPGITAIRQDSYRLGAKSAEILLERITASEGVREPVMIQLSNELMKRNSTTISE